MYLGEKDYSILLASLSDTEHSSVGLKVMRQRNARAIRNSDHSYEPREVGNTHNSTQLVCVAELSMDPRFVQALASMLSSATHTSCVLL